MLRSRSASECSVSVLSIEPMDMEQAKHLIDAALRFSALD